jgi:polysaccharide export outer membrane protein
LVSALAAGVIFCVACGHGQSGYVWADQLPPQAAPDRTYRIGVGDVLAVRVWNQEAMSTPRARVREDGAVSLPLLHDVPGAGLTPAEFAHQLETRLKTYVVNPVVTVSVEEIRPVRVSILGEVVRPGQYELERDAGVLHALAAGGGTTQFAERDRIFVLRADDKAAGAPPTRIRFRYDSLVHGSGPATSFRLQDGDVVVVE